MDRRGTHSPHNPHVSFSPTFKGTVVKGNEGMEGETLWYVHSNIPRLWLKGRHGGNLMEPTKGEIEKGRREKLGLADKHPPSLSPTGFHHLKNYLVSRFNILPLTFIVVLGSSSPSRWYPQDTPTATYGHGHTQTNTRQRCTSLLGQRAPTALLLTSNGHHVTWLKRSKLSYIAESTLSRCVKFDMPGPCVPC